MVKVSPSDSDASVESLLEPPDVKCWSFVNVDSKQQSSDLHKITKLFCSVR